MDAHVAQWIGTRSNQEDAYAVRHWSEGSLAVVCDGMGGHSRGDEAARTAATRFVEAFGATADAGMTVTQRLRDALRQANAAVGALYEGTDLFGGTTLLAVYASRGLVRWISVGDSPLYVWRRDSLKRLNEDHSMRAVYAQWVTPGGMTRRDALNSGHMLRSAVTGRPIELIDAPERPFPMLPGDRLLLCTDGIEALVEQKTVLPLAVRRLFMQRGDNLAALLVEACRELGEEYADNVTVVSMDA